jgi:hypothetical protein
VFVCLSVCFCLPVRLSGCVKGEKRGAEERREMKVG